MAFKLLDSDSDESHILYHDFLLPTGNVCGCMNMYVCVYLFIYKIALTFAACGVLYFLFHFFKMVAKYT